MARWLLALQRQGLRLQRQRPSEVLQRLGSWLQSRLPRSLAPSRSLTLSCLPAVQGV